jgi:DNA-binding beta-propeller fold protein YncE
MASKFSRGRRKRFSAKMLIGFGVTFTVILIAGAVFALQTLVPSHAAPPRKWDFDAHTLTTIDKLKHISQVGSTANILNAQGKHITVDPNPYKIAIAPAGLAPSLQTGDILVSNIGNEDHGTTLVKFPGQGGSGRLFNTQTDGVLGPAGLTFDNGRLLVGNSTGNSVLIFNPNGTLFATITNPLFNGPWGIATGNVRFDGKHNTISTFFTANKIDAKILRVDMIWQDKGKPQFKVTQVGMFAKNGDLTKIDLHWQPWLKVGKQTLKDVLLAVDPANNRIAAFADSSDHPGTGNGMTIFKGKPLNMPGGLAINPLNGDLLVVNLMNNNLVELNPTSGKVVAVKQIDPTAVDNQGNGSALFGVAAIRDKVGNLRVFFTDDNTNTLDVLAA